MPFNSVGMKNPSPPEDFTSPLHHHTCDAMVGPLPRASMVLSNLNSQGMPRGNGYLGFLGIAWSLASTLLACHLDGWSSVSIAHKKKPLKRHLSKSPKKLQETLWSKATLVFQKHPCYLCYLPTSDTPTNGHCARGVFHSPYRTDWILAGSEFEVRRKTKRWWNKHSKHLASSLTTSPDFPVAQAQWEAMS